MNDVCKIENENITNCFVSVSDIIYSRCIFENVIFENFQLLNAEYCVFEQCRNNIDLKPVKYNSLKI